MARDSRARTPKLSDGAHTQREDDLHNAQNAESSAN
jgi:hypothetical protein